MESNDSNETPDRGETSDIPSLPLGYESTKLVQSLRELVDMIRPERWWDFGEVPTFDANIIIIIIIIGNLWRPIS